MPIVGTYSKSKYPSQKNFGGPSLDVYSEKQKKPFVPGEVDVYWSSGTVPNKPERNSKTIGYSLCDYNSPPTTVAHDASQRAMGRLVNHEVLSRAAMGVNLSQASQAWLMLASRLRQVASAVSRAKRLDVIGALEALNPWRRQAGELMKPGYTPHAFSNAISLVTKDKNPVSLKKFKSWPAEKRERYLKTRTVANMKKFTGSTSSLWLELTFGWSPLLGDIYSTCDVLSQEFPVDRLKASAKSAYVGPMGGGAIGDRITVTQQVRARVSADFRVSNPNLLLLNQLGLLNPAAIAWDLVPFSFVIDWFLPVNRFINSWSAQAGYELRNPVWSRKYTISVDLVSQTHDVFTTDARRYNRGRNLPSHIQWTGAARLPQPSLWLASTSASLIVQKLKTFR